MEVGDNTSPEHTSSTCETKCGGAFPKKKKIVGDRLKLTLDQL